MNLYWFGWRPATSPDCYSGVYYGPYYRQVDDYGKYQVGSGVTIESSGRPSERLSAIVKTMLSRYPIAGQRWLGYSGGLDSTVLLHILVQQQIPVRALHIHHGLSPHAAEWQAHCVEAAGSLGVPITVQRVSVVPTDGGLEQGARNARYEAFRHQLAVGDQILLAHHGDDQAETFLLRLLRGAGNLGLAGMTESRALDGGSLLRPLLGVSRAQLEDYARAHDLRWVEDESNQDLSLERNYLRAQVLPLLAARWPVVQKVARACANLRESAQLLSEVAQEDLQRCGRRAERFGESVELKLLSNLSTIRQNNLMRGWLGGLAGRMPEASHLEQALQQGLNAAADSQMAVALGGRVLRRFRDRLYLTPQLPEIDTTGERQWDGVSELSLPGGWLLYRSADWPAGDYRVVLRKGGERAKPVFRQHSQTLKKVLQELDLEPWLRDRVPLIYLNGELVAVAGLCVCSSETEQLPNSDTRGLASSPPNWRFCSLSD